MNEHIIENVIKLSSSDDLEARYREWRSTLALPTCAHHGEKLSVQNSDWYFASEDGRRVWSKREPTEERNASSSRDSDSILCRAIAGCDECGDDWAMEMRGVPRSLARASFKNFHADTAELKSNREKCELYSKDTRGFLLMCGPVGVGKTHLGVATMKGSKFAAKSAYISQVELIRQLRETYNHPPRRTKEMIEDEIVSIRAEGYHRHTEQERYTIGYMTTQLQNANLPLIERYREHGLLFLDEFGVHAGASDVEHFIFDLIAYRHGNLLPTILCSNFNVQELHVRLGDQIMDRLIEALSFQVNFTGDSYRRAARAAYLDRARER